MGDFEDLHLSVTRTSDDGRMDRPREVRQFVAAAVEASVYICPTTPGLAREEFFELGRRLGYEQGEIGDAIDYGLNAGQLAQLGRLVEPDEDLNPLWDTFLRREDPEYRSVRAFDFVQLQFQDVARKLGVQKAQIGRSELVERGIASGVPRVEIEATLAILKIMKHMSETGDVLRLAPGRESRPLTSEILAQYKGQPTQSRPMLDRVYTIVRDVIERRVDGRASSSEPLDAFADQLVALGYAPFRLWWMQSAAELKRLSPELNPVAVSVLAAALVEGALTFVVRHARSSGLNVLGSKTFDEPPQRWKIDDCGFRKL